MGYDGLGSTEPKEGFGLPSSEETMVFNLSDKFVSNDAPAEDDDKMEEIPADELAEAYEALKEVIPQMDYEAVEMIVKQVEGYRLPDKDKEFFERLDALLKKVDWDKMEELIDHE